MAIAVEAYPNPRVERWPLLGRLKPEMQMALRALYHVILEIEKKPTPTNKFGIVIPPAFAECVGEECRFRDGPDGCKLSRHHLHSTASDHENDSELAVEFRNLEPLTVWLPYCVHDGHHAEHRIHVPIPHPNIMRQAKYESGRVKKLITNHRENKNNEKMLNTTPNLTRRGIRRLNGIRDQLAEHRETLLNEVVTGLEVIPDEIVTGALLLVASDLAQRRIRSGMEYTLPGVIDKSEIPIALANAHDAQAQAA